MRDSTEKFSQSHGLIRAGASTIVYYGLLWYLVFFPTNRVAPIYPISTLFLPYLYLISTLFLPYFLPFYHLLSPVLSGKTELEQLHLIVKTIGTPTESTWQVLLKSKQNAKFFDFLHENRLVFVVLSGRFQNLFWKILRFWRLVATATIIHNHQIIIVPVTTKRQISRFSRWFISFVFEIFLTFFHNF